MHTCEACGKEMEKDQQYCDECAEIYATMDEPKKSTAPKSTPVKKKTSNAGYTDERRGHGASVASLVLAIIGFVLTGICCLSLYAVKDMLWEVLNEAFASEFNGVVATTPEEISILETFATIMKVAFGAAHFGLGGIFLLIGLICNIVAICKYCGNKAEDKVKSTIVIACIALAFIITTIAIAAAGTSSYAKMIDEILAPYIG